MSYFHILATPKVARDDADQMQGHLVQAYSAEQAHALFEYENPEMVVQHVASRPAPKTHDERLASLASLSHGQRVWWNDPDRNISSGWGVLVSESFSDPEDIVVMKRDDGAYVEVYLQELEQDDDVGGES